MGMGEREEKGHREVVCAGCCVERGREGVVVCLGCEGRGGE